MPDDHEALTAIWGKNDRVSD